MSTRLATDKRNTIARRVIDHAFGERIANLQKAEHALADEIYNAIYPPEVQNPMKGLPPGFLEERTDVVAYVDGEYHVLRLSSPRRVGEYSWRDNRDRCSFLPGSPLSKAILSHSRLKEQLDKEKREAQDSIHAVLSSTRTVDRLVELWPEVKEFTLDLLPSPKKVTALAIPTPELNRMFKLPPKHHRTKETKC